MREDKVVELGDLLRKALILADEMNLQTVAIRIAETIDLINPNTNDNDNGPPRRTESDTDSSRLTVR